MSLTFSPTQETDILRITEIYNQAIETMKCTADCDKVTIKERKKWLSEHSKENYPVYTCFYADEVIGYTYFSAYRFGRKAVDKVAEVSIFLDANFQGKGFGGATLDFMLRTANDRGFRTLIAIIIDVNMASKMLFSHRGFEEWGRFPKIVELAGEKWDHLYFGLTIV